MIIEDNFHECKCKAYSDIRLKYFPQFNKLFKIYKMDVYEQFYNVIETEKYKLLVNYISEIWQTRKSKLYCWFSSLLLSDHCINGFKVTYNIHCISVVCIYIHCIRVTIINKINKNFIFYQ